MISCLASFCFADSGNDKIFEKIKSLNISFKKDKELCNFFKKTSLYRSTPAIFEKCLDKSFLEYKTAEKKYNESLLKTCRPETLYFSNWLKEAERRFSRDYLIKNSEAIKKIIGLNSFKKAQVCSENFLKEKFFAEVIFLNSISLFLEEVDYFYEKNNRKNPYKRKSFEILQLIEKNVKLESGSTRLMLMINEVSLSPEYKNLKAFLNDFDFLTDDRNLIKAMNDLDSYLKRKD